jgi:putative endonuclease
LHAEGQRFESACLHHSSSSPCGHAARYGPSQKDGIQKSIKPLEKSKGFFVVYILLVYSDTLILSIIHYNYWFFIMYYVYVLKSLSKPAMLYIGYTIDMAHSLAVHNEGKAIYTNKYKPWELAWQCVFFDQAKALAFEKYLKTGSGKLFLAKHIL